MAKKKAGELKKCMGERDFSKTKALNPVKSSRLKIPRPPPEIEVKKPIGEDILVIKNRLD